MKKTLLFVFILGLLISLVLSSCSGAETTGSNLKEIFSIGQTETVYAATPDYTCDGVDDDVQFQQALDDLPAAGGEIVILAGTYVFGATVLRAIDNVTFTGVGMSANLTYDDSSFLINASTQTGWIFQNFATDAGSVNITGALESAIWGIWVDGVYTTQYPGASSGDSIWDADGDTGIQVEEGSDDDHIRMDVGGSGGDDVFLLHDNGILSYGKQSAAKALQTVPQAIPIAATKVILPIEIYDIQGEFDNAVNYRFTATEDGAYFAIGNIQFTNIADQVMMFAMLFVNGLNTAQAINVQSGGPQGGGAIVTDVLNLVAGDYVELYVLQVWQMPFPTISQSYLTIAKIA